MADQKQDQSPVFEIILSGVAGVRLRKPALLWLILSWTVLSALAMSLLTVLSMSRNSGA